MSSTPLAPCRRTPAWRVPRSPTQALHRCDQTYLYIYFYWFVVAAALVVLALVGLWKASDKLKPVAASVRKCPPVQGYLPLLHA